MLQRIIILLLAIFMAVHSGIKQIDDFQEEELIFVPKATPMNVHEDAAELKDAIYGVGNQVTRIVNVLTRRTYEQRQFIAEKYKSLYSTDLMSDMKGHIGANLLQIIESLMIEPLDYLATELGVAMKGFGTDEDAITEILCTHSSQDIKKIADFYYKHYKKSLSVALNSELSGYYNKLMQTLIEVERTRFRDTRNLSRTLLPKIEKKTLFHVFQSEDKSRFTNILGRVTFHQIQLITGDFFEIGRKTLRDTIMKETSGDFRTALLTIVDVAENRPLFFATKLYHSMARFRTNDRMMTRIIVTRSEIDMQNIKKEFERVFNKPLQEMIVSETSGPYRQVLLNLIDGLPN